MKKIVTFIAFLSTFVFASVDHVNYKATFGVFGTVGSIHNTLTKNTKTYVIDTTVKMAGLAKMIMGGQVEHYTSKGHFHNGLMVSDVYTMETKKKHQRKLREYTINHTKKYVTKRYRKWSHGKLVKDTVKKLKFYAENDLLTLYFNMNKAITNKGKVYHMKAVGLEKQKGLVEVTVPTDKNNKAYKKDLGSTANWYAKALIVQKNFKKKKGDILLSVSKDGYIKKSVIKDILMYGDAKLIRTK